LTQVINYHWTSFFLFTFSSGAGLDYAEQVGLTHYYHVCYEGCLTNFEIGDEGEEASKLYPEVKYTKIEDYLKQYV
ncbi:unnamed protein product, partial [Coffea canephora]